MSGNVAAALDLFRRASSLRQGPTANPFKLVSSLDVGAEPEEVRLAWGGDVVPLELSELWTSCRGARLFEDVEYGQWGLVLLGPSASAARTAVEHRARPTDIAAGDIVIGEFLGDQDLLIYASGETDNRRVLVALPLYHRPDWVGVGATLTEFLVRYCDHSGAKFWEPSDDQ